MAVSDRAEPLDTRCTGAGASNPRSRGPLNNIHEGARYMAVTSAQTRQVSDSLARLLTLLPATGSARDTRLRLAIEERMYAVE